MKRINRSIGFQLIVPVVLMAIGITVILAVLTTNIYTTLMLQQEQDKAQSCFAIVSNAIAGSIDNIQHVTAQDALDATISAYANLGFDNNVDLVLARQRCRRTMSEMLEKQPNVYGFLFMREDGSLFGIARLRNYFIDNAENSIFSRNILETIRNSGSKSVWIGPFDTAEIIGFSPANAACPDRVMLGIRRLRLAGSSLKYVLTIIESSLYDEALGLMTDNDSGVCLTTRSGAIITAVGNEKAIEEADLMSAAPGMESRAIRLKNGGRALLSTCALSAPDWTIIRVMPMEMYDRAAGEVRRRIWIYAAALLFAGLFFYAQWLHRFTGSFYALKNGLVHTGAGKLNTRLDEPFPVNEFEEIRCAFNDMNTSLEDLVAKNRQIERERYRLEIRSLQTQISPHMVFNTITAIRWMAIMIGADSVADALSEFAELMRPVLREWRVLWTLREELDHLDHYANLVSLRFGSRFLLSCQVPPEMLEVSIPRFTLQPLVENACEHGGHPQDKLEVRIDGWIWKDIACLSIANNGESITDAEIAAVEAAIRAPGDKRMIGIPNVVHRLRLCMGDDSALKLERRAQGGTRVVICWHLRQASGSGNIETPSG